MSKLTDSFREVKVFNPHDFYGHGNVYVAYRKLGRCISSGWLVHRPGYNAAGPVWVCIFQLKTDPNGHWAEAVETSAKTAANSIWSWING